MAEAAIAAYDPQAAAARRRYALSRVAIYGTLSVFAAVYILPLLVIIANSFRELPEIVQNGLIGFPHSFSFKAWSAVWNSYCSTTACASRHRGDTCRDITLDTTH